MKKLESICVYCGSSRGRGEVYEATASRLGAEMAQAGIRLVYGGGSVGLMGVVARSVLDHGGEVTGIIPEFLKDQEKMLERAHELIVTQDMHERKQLMFSRADAFIALPGGVGTLEELVEMLTWAQLGRHNKPVLLADVDGFWKPFKTLLDHMGEEGFIRSGLEVHFDMCANIEEAVPRLQAAYAAQQGEAD